LLRKWPIGGGRLRITILLGVTEKSKSIVENGKNILGSDKKLFLKLKIVNFTADGRLR
jgi:hypothetical protein